MDEKERARALDLTLGQIEKQFGKGSILRLGSKDAIVPVSVISTGSISLDAALGVGGLPRGRVCEIYGPESSGKTTIALQVIAEAQKKGGMAAYRSFAEYLMQRPVERLCGPEVAAEWLFDHDARVLGPAHAAQRGDDDRKRAGRDRQVVERARA